MGILHVFKLHIYWNNHHTVYTKWRTQAISPGVKGCPYFTWRNRPDVQWWPGIPWRRPDVSRREPPMSLLFELHQFLPELHALLVEFVVPLPQSPIVLPQLLNLDLNPVFWVTASGTPIPLLIHFGNLKRQYSLLIMRYLPLKDLCFFLIDNFSTITLT